MKAVQYQQFGGPDVLQYVDVADPTPAAGEVLIATEGIGVNFPDIRERLGTYNKAETRVGGVTLPQVGGLAVAGRVVAVGQGSDQSLAGRQVVALMKKGAYAQFAIAAETLCAVVDDDADRGRRRSAVVAPTLPSIVVRRTTKDLIGVTAAMCGLCVVRTSEGSLLSR